MRWEEEVKEVKEMGSLGKPYCLAGRVGRGKTTVRTVPVYKYVNWSLEEMKLQVMATAPGSASRAVWTLDSGMLG